MERWKGVSMVLFGIILVLGISTTYNTYAQQIESFEQEINNSYVKGLNEGFSIGQEFQFNTTNDYIVQSLQQQGWIDFPVFVGNESGNIKLVLERG